MTAEFINTYLCSAVMFTCGGEGNVAVVLVCCHISPEPGGVLLSEVAPPNSAPTLVDFELASVSRT